MYVKQLIEVRVMPSSDLKAPSTALLRGWSHASGPRYEHPMEKDLVRVWPGYIVSPLVKEKNGHSPQEPTVICFVFVLFLVFFSVTVRLD